MPSVRREFDPLLAAMAGPSGLLLLVLPLRRWRRGSRGEVVSAIDPTTMQRVARMVEVAIIDEPDVEWHTVKVITNGQHGGVDVTLEGDRHGALRLRQVVLR